MREGLEWACASRLPFATSVSFAEGLSDQEVSSCAEARPHTGWNPFFWPGPGLIHNKFCLEVCFGIFLHLMIRTPKTTFHSYFPLSSSKTRCRLSAWSHGGQHNVFIKQVLKLSMRLLTCLAGSWGQFILKGEKPRAHGSKLWIWTRERDPHRCCQNFNLAR